MNTLQLRYEIVDESVTLRPFIDGQDVLASYRNDQGVDPDRLLPPVSSTLLPTGSAHRVLVGVCSCGETGCGSLALQVSRVGSQVIWAPEDRAQDETLAREYRFELVQYLDAVDRAAGEPPLGEGLGRRVARAVRVLIGLYDQTYGSLTAFENTNLDWISAWPWTSDTVKASVTTAGEQRILEYRAAPPETEAEFASRIASEIKDSLLGRP